MTVAAKNNYASGSYWRARKNLLYYQYFRYMVECIGVDAQSMVDVGSGNAPYLEWFDWIPERVSVDIRSPYTSETVRGVEGDILTIKFDHVFDLCTCMQVLEHIPEPAPFAQRLLEMGKLLLVSVPYKWPAGETKGHVHDPVSLDSLIKWFGRRPNYHLTVKEPFAGKRGERLFAIFDPHDPDRRFGKSIRRKA